MAPTRMDALIAWAGAIIDRLCREAPEELEDTLAETAVLMVVPSIAISPGATWHDNDAGGEPDGPPDGGLCA